MDWSRWTRSPEKVRAALKEQPDNSVVTSKPLKIYVPKRFMEKQLAQVAAEIYIVGIFAMVVDDTYYGVSTVNAMMRIKPTSIATGKFVHESYLEFQFDPGSVVIANTLLIKNDVLVYKIFDEIVAKGHTPWYVGYEDLAKLFASAEKHAGVKLKNSHAILEMFAAAVARDSVERSNYFRHVVKDQFDYVNKPPTIIPLRSVSYGTTNTTAKLLGSYWDDGLTSALVNPSTKTERIEELLRR